MKYYEEVQLQIRVKAHMYPWYIGNPTERNKRNPDGNPDELSQVNATTGEWYQE